MNEAVEFLVYAMTLGGWRHLDRAKERKLWREKILHEYSIQSKGTNAHYSWTWTKNNPGELNQHFCSLMKPRTIAAANYKRTIAYEGGWVLDPRAKV